jgi:hypothetical protein
VPKIVNPLEKSAVVRLLEFLSERKPWFRSLWGVGIVLAMEELYEACTALRQGHLSEAAIKRMASSLQKRAGVHPAFTEAEKQFLRQQLHHVPRAEGVAHFGLRELSVCISSDYLTRWSRAVAAGRFTVEHFARSVAAYLLDAGFSGQYLRDFIKARLDAPESITLPQLCDALQAEMFASPHREFEVLLAFTTIPATLNGVPPSWLRGVAVITWLKENGFDTAGVRAPAAIVLKIKARDAIGAAQAARSESDRHVARALVATGEQLNRVPMLWVKGCAAPAPMKGASREVGVRELFREDRVFSADVSQSVDAALELLAHLEGTSAPAAVAGGWGAIEGLLACLASTTTAADDN